MYKTRVKKIKNLHLVPSSCWFDFSQICFQKLIDVKKMKKKMGRVFPSRLLQLSLTNKAAAINQLLFIATTSANISFFTFFFFWGFFFSLIIIFLSLSLYVYVSVYVCLSPHVNCQPQKV